MEGAERGGLLILLAVFMTSLVFGWYLNTLLSYVLLGVGISVIGSMMVDKEKPMISGLFILGVFVSFVVKVFWFS